MDEEQKLELIRKYKDVVIELLDIQQIEFQDTTRVVIQLLRSRVKELEKK